MLNLKPEMVNSIYFLQLVKSNYNNNDPLPRFILNKSVDGIIIAGKVPQNLIDRITVLNIPISFC